MVDKDEDVVFVIIAEHYYLKRNVYVFLRQMHLNNTF